MNMKKNRVQIDFSCIQIKVVFHTAIPHPCRRVIKEFLHCFGCGEIELKMRLRIWNGNREARVALGYACGFQLNPTIILTNWSPNICCLAPSLSPTPSLQIWDNANCIIPFEFAIFDESNEHLMYNRTFSVFLFQTVNVSVTMTLLFLRKRLFWPEQLFERRHNWG